MAEAACSLGDIQHRYGERTVLRVATLDIPQGEIFALVGPSGAGKSTFLRLIALLETPTLGRVELHLKSKSFTFQTATLEVRRQIAMVFQRPVLLSQSVRANVAYGLRGNRDAAARVEAILQAVLLTHLANAPARTLSGGEIQRVAVARALILEPQILLLDEPTANLDPYNAKIIETFIRQQQQRLGSTIILVTHNIFQAKWLAERVGLLLDGELVEVAPTEQFFTHPQDSRTARFLSGDLVY